MFQTCPMKIKVKGRPTHMQAMESAEEIVIKNRTQIAPKVIAYLETHDYREPLLLALPVGSGKTYTTIHHVVPWAVERKLQVLFISSRSAINLQVKEELLNVVGLTNLRRQLTDEGLSKQEEFGPVTVMTYHKLGILLQREPDTLKKYGVIRLMLCLILTLTTEAVITTELKKPMSDFAMHLLMWIRLESRRSWERLQNFVRSTNALASLVVSEPECD